MSGRPAALVAAVLTLYLATAGAAEDAKPPGPVRRAVLVGVNDYAAAGLVDLQGAVNDVGTMRRILVSGYGFDELNVTVLTDAEATRARVLAALESLVEASGADDVAYIHFSGHGSQVEDTNGDETDDGLDETILPVDARTEGVADITDDELGALLGRLRARTAVVVLDACHSGTATRGGAVPRSAPPDTRTELYRSSTPGTRALVTLDLPERYVLMTGAAAHQSALDLPLPGRQGGLFTYALAESLTELGPAASPRQLHDSIASVLTRLSESLGGLRFPEPQIEAADRLLDRPLMPGSVTSGAARPYAELRPGTAERVVLVDGALLGATVGSIWAVFGTAETEFTPAAALVRGRVTALDGADALIEPADARPLPGRGRAVLQSVPLEDRLVVRVEGLSAAKREELERRVQASEPRVAFVERGPARWVVRAEGDHLTLLDSTATQRIDTTPADEPGAERLVGFFRRSLNANALLALRNPLSRLRLEARRVDDAPGAPLAVRRAGDPRSARNSLQLEIRVNADSYVTVVDVDPSGEMNLLFPTPRSRPDFLPEGRVLAGTTVRIPDRLESGNAAGFFWDARPPVGVDTIRVFASTDHATAEAIRRWVGAPPTSQTRGTTTPEAFVPATALERLKRLQDALYRAPGSPSPPRAMATRSAPAMQAAEPDWTAVTIRVMIAE